MVVIFKAPALPPCAITGARVFDGEALVDVDCVIMSDGIITDLCDRPAPGTTVIDGHGATLLPGLIDSHVHTGQEGLRQALRFGITTLCDMGSPPFLAEERRRYADDDSLADLRSAGPPVTAPCGHPNALILGRQKLFSPECGCQHHAQVVPGVESLESMPDEIDTRVRQGSDWIKVIAEDGTVFGEPEQPTLTSTMLRAAVRSAHEHTKLAVAHALTYDATVGVLNAGVDGLAHIFVDRPHDGAIVDLILRRHAFVVPTLAMLRAITGHTGEDFGADPRVAARLSAEQARILSGTFATYPDGDFRTALASVGALHGAGARLLAGSDSFGHALRYGGVVSGASLHHELQLLACAGIPAREVLAMATSAPADVFGLTDRGRIVPGARADLLLVDGDPLEDVAATLSTRAVWRRGVMSRPLADIAVPAVGSSARP